MKYIHVGIPDKLYESIRTELQKEGRTWKHLVWTLLQEWLRSKKF